METRLPVVIVSALGAVLAPNLAHAEGARSEPVLAVASAPYPAFDLGQMGWGTSAPLRGTAPTTARFEEDGQVSTKKKVKLRWQYQPVEGGPRFEVGTYGSRKGAMKSKLLHVAMDWRF